MTFNEAMNSGLPFRHTAMSDWLHARWSEKLNEYSIQWESGKTWAPRWDLVFSNEWEVQDILVEVPGWMAVYQGCTARPTRRWYRNKVDAEKELLKLSKRGIRCSLIPQSIQEPEE